MDSVSEELLLSQQVYQCLEFTMTQQSGLEPATSRSSVQYFNNYPTGNPLVYTVYPINHVTYGDDVHSVGSAGQGQRCDTSMLGIYCIIKLGIEVCTRRSQLGNLIQAKKVIHSYINNGAGIFIIIAHSLADVE